MKRLEAFDDLDWSEKQEVTLASRTVYLGYEGRWVELDLTDEHAVELGAALARYLEAGSKPESTPRPGSAAGPRSGARARNAAILAWALENGWPNASAKYIPAKAKKAYAAAHAGGEAAQ